MGASKRALSELPKNWQSKILDNAALQWSTYKSDTMGALAVLKAIGCRPSELALGVQVRKVGENWTFAVHGTKVGETGGSAKPSQKRGIPFRQITVCGTGQNWSRYLGMALGGGTEGTIKIASGDALATKMRRLVVAEWGDIKNKPSPYSFRHACAREMRNSLLPVETIAKVLGHASCTSQGAYGWKRAGGTKGPKREAIASVSPRNGKERANVLAPAKNTMAGFKAASKARKSAKTKSSPRSPKI
jgi:integrase